MNKTYIAVGVLAAVILVAGIASIRSPWSARGVGSVAAPIGSTEGGLAANTVLVTYSDKGFTPVVIRITRGTSIRFLNTSGKALRIAPLADPAYNTNTYQGFEASKSIKRGESYEISVPIPGVWGYKNQLWPNAVGVAIVE